MTYNLNVAGLKRELQLCRLNDEMYIAAFILFGDVELTTACAQKLLELAPEHDYMMTAEAKGIPLICEMARLSGQNKYFVARKSPKLYMKEVFEVEVKSISTEKKQRLYLDSADAELMRGKRVLLVDDVISTGESMAALEQLALEAGAEIAGRMAVLAEGGAVERGDIIFLERLPLFDADGKEM